MVVFNEVCDKGSDTIRKYMEMRSGAQASRIDNLEAVMVEIKFEQVVWHYKL